MAVVLTQNLLNSFRGRTGIVERNTGNKVVQNVGLDNVMEDVRANKGEFTVNSSSGTTSKVPFLMVIVRKSRISVLEVGNENQPVVDPQVGHNVVAKDRSKSPLLDGKVDQTGGSENTEIRNDNVQKVLLVKDRRCRNKVVVNPLGTTLIALASNVSKEVQDPAKELLAKHVSQGINRGILNCLGSLAKRQEELLSLGVKDSVTLEVGSVLVVLTMRNAPRVIRNKESRVKEPTSDIIDSLRIRESTVATFVSKDPASSAKETVDKTIGNPGNDTERNRRNKVNVLVSEISNNTNKEKIAGHIRKGLDVGTLVAFGRNNVEDFLNGDLRDFKSVTVGVNGRGDSTLVSLEFGLVGLRGLRRTALSECRNGRHVFQR